MRNHRDIPQLTQVAHHTAELRSLVVRRQIIATVIGIVVAVTVIYSVFDQRVSFTKYLATASTQSPAN
jgi:hypothetical protein